MVNLNKTIKDLKERNDKLTNQCLQHEARYLSSLNKIKELERQNKMYDEVIKKIKKEINWIISTTSDDTTIARCNIILKLLEVL